MLYRKYWEIRYIPTGKFCTSRWYLPAGSDRPNIWISLLPTSFQTSADNYRRNLSAPPGVSMVTNTCYPNSLSSQKISDETFFDTYAAHSGQTWGTASPRKCFLCNFPRDFLARRVCILAFLLKIIINEMQAADFGNRPVLLKIMHCVFVRVDWAFYCCSILLASVVFVEVLLLFPRT